MATLDPLVGKRSHRSWERKQPLLLFLLGLKHREEGGNTVIVVSDLAFRIRIPPLGLEAINASR
jgi:hypothetical protein